MSHSQILVSDYVLSDENGPSGYALSDENDPSHYAPSDESDLSDYALSDENDLSYYTLSDGSDVNGCSNVVIDRWSVVSDFEAGCDDPIFACIRRLSCDEFESDPDDAASSIYNLEVKRV